ncbi:MULTISPECIES: caspase family protein [Bradyrhizobium]|uniref:caspase family protein n=1 Tax=Bradyrhizobium TaxID=374 RepID=UPI0020A0CC16|nr:caspase family protein [Bradyrhizobium elkanii]MCP1970064.1 hypothetical protein [Bradyrhizobium elkanii]MCS4108429.1 hypothetical protein [Bradyrhizobium elkanii]WLA36464.1 caspase family protein [Bradyrhizobium elkanii]
MLAGAAFALIGCVAASIPAFAERRVALVIGNSAYRSTVQLPNPRNDATDVARMLKSAGFEVVEGVDLDKRGMDDAFHRFADVAAGADAALARSRQGRRTAAGAGRPAQARTRRPLRAGYARGTARRGAGEIAVGCSVITHDTRSGIQIATISDRHYSFPVRRA